MIGRSSYNDLVLQFPSSGPGQWDKRKAVVGLLERAGQSAFYFALVCIFLPLTGVRWSYRRWGAGGMTVRKDQISLAPKLLWTSDLRTFCSVKYQSRYCLANGFQLWQVHDGFSETKEWQWNVLGVKGLTTWLCSPSDGSSTRITSTSSVCRSVILLCLCLRPEH